MVYKVEPLPFGGFRWVFPSKFASRRWAEACRWVERHGGQLPEPRQYGAKEDKPKKEVK